MSILDSMNVSEAMRAGAAKEIEEFKSLLKAAIDRHAKEHGVANTEIQFAIRMTDHPITGDGSMYYQLMKSWKPLRNANFSMDFLGESLPMDTTGKENIIVMYMMGSEELGLPSTYTTIANTYGVKKWAQISIIFYRPKNDPDKIKIGVYITPEAGGAPKRMELIDLFD